VHFTATAQQLLILRLVYREGTSEIKLVNTANSKV
jgi:hypothetical protein